jgi:hypothetical protein
MPSVKIENMNIIRANLNVLASFDGHTGLGGKGARKLHINTATGEFGTKDGLFQNFFQRTKQDSLLHPDTMKTISDMFEFAIKQMNKATGHDKRREETRKLLFRGFRGLVYLADHYRLEQNYNALKVVLKNIESLLSKPLESILSRGIKDQLWFETGLYVKKTTSFVQTDFIDAPMGGICHGICMDWCRRVVVKKKFSYASSSKDYYDQIIQEVDAYQMAQIDSEKNRILDNVLHDPNLTSEEAQKAEYMRQGLGDPMINKAVNIMSTTKKILQNYRFQKKSTYQALVQHTQKMNAHLVSDKILELINHKNDSQAKLDKGFHEIEVYDFVGLPRTNQVPLTDEEKNRLRKTIMQIDDSLKRIGVPNDNGGDLSLEKAARKFSRMEYNETDSIEITKDTVLCISDPTEFEPHLNTLITKCINSMDNVTPKAFFLSFNYGGTYAGISHKGGHALAFAKHTKDNNVDSYHAIDPNFGDFSSTTKEGLIFIFSVVLSWYSLTRNFTRIETATVSLRDN